MTRPWTWHPPPHPGEALTSWIARLAAGYAMRPKVLLAEPCGPTMSPSEHVRIDAQAPDWIISRLAAGTGTPPAAIAALTIAGLLPYLADTITTDDTAAGYHTFIERSRCCRPQAGEDPSR